MRCEAEPRTAVEDDDLLGVEIEITPAGKSMKRLSLLSGGEKSMTALAFLFAVFLARPCPFYILDEVEAALDDLNIDRFLDLLRRLLLARAVHRRHPSEADDGGGGLAVRRLDGRGRHLQGHLAPAASARAAEASPRLPRSRARTLLTSPRPWRATGPICSYGAGPPRGEP